MEGGAGVEAEPSGWNSSGDDAGELAVPRRGRPRKQALFGEGQVKRSRGRPSAKSQAAGSHEQRPADTPCGMVEQWGPSRLQAFARPVGDEVSVQMSALFGLPSQAGHSEVQSRLFDRCFGPTPRRATPIKVEAEAVGLQGTSGTWFKSLSMFLGACTCFCARQAWASTISWLAREAA